jgi:hypothetical protein
MTWNIRRFVLCCVAALPLLAAAEVYKWVDENGKIQFGDQPPPGAKTQAVKPHPSGGFVASDAGKGNEVKVQAAGGPAKPQVDKQAAARNCDIMTKNVENASTADALLIKDKNGQERSVGGLDRLDEVEKMRKERDRWCALAK